MKLKNKRILITGATGLIGSNLVEKLLQRGNVLYVTGRDIQKLGSTFQKHLGSNNLITVEHDICIPIPTELKDIDIIFHAAGPMEREIVMNKPVSVLLPNTIGTINCLDFLRKQEIKTGKRGRMVVFSSVTVYANPTHEDYIAEESDTTHAISLDQPYACYAESKRMSEVIAQSYRRQFDIDVVIARFSTVFGYCKNIPNTAFFEFINKAMNGEDISLNSVGMPRRDNIYVDDAVSGLITIAEKGEKGEAYNISSNGDFDNYVAIDEIAGQIAEVTSHILGKRYVRVNMPMSDAPRKPGLMLANEKLKSLGWSIETTHKDGLVRTIEHFL